MATENLEQLDPRGGVQVISRAAAIMRALGARPEGMSLAEIAKEVELPRSTVQRLVTALEIEELVDAKGPNGGTRLGPAIGQLLAAAHADAVVFGRYYLQSLIETLNETASIVTLVGTRSMVLESFSADNVLRVVLSLGEQSPLYSTAGGKAILATLSDELIAELCPEPFEQLTALTLTSFAALRDQISMVRETGFAYAREERTPGLSTIAMAVKTVLGIYALEVSVPDARYDQKKPEIERALAACRRSIVASVGEAESAPVGYVKDGAK